jgi:predicted Zn-dependent peptidase
MRPTTRSLARGAAAASLLVLGASGAPAQTAPRQAPPPPGPARNFALPAPARLTLPNGLPVTLVPFGLVPKVAIRLVVDAGNVHEQAGEVWLADLAGRMMKEGTASLTGESLARAFAGMGGELAVSVGLHATNISAEVLSERAADAVRLIAEVARQPRWPEDALARVKGDMARELAIAKSQPQAVAAESFAALLYGDHPYGRMFPTDTMLAGYTLDQVRAFYRQRFGGNRARLYVAGVFDRAALEAAVREALGSWAPASGAPAPQPPPARPRGFALIDRPGAPQSTLMIGRRVPDPSSPAWTALQVTDSLLGGSFTSRITSNIREAKGYTYSPYSIVQSMVGSAYWSEAADVSTDVTGAAIQEIVNEIERLGREAPPAAELRGIQNNLAGTFVVSNASRAGVIGQLVFVDRYTLGDDYLAKYVERIGAVTPEQVRQTARQYLAADAMTLVVVGDTKTVKPQVARWADREP